VDGGTTVRLDDTPRIVLGTSIRRFRGAILISTGPESFQLEGSGAYLFRNVNHCTSVAALARGLATEYDIEEPEAVADTVEFVQLLMERRVVELHASGEDWHPST
jgi:hypothetical protein